MKRRSAVWFALATLVLVVQVAEAYLDPGTGSFVIQVVMGAFFGVLVALRVWWKRIVAFIGKHTGYLKGHDGPRGG